MFIKTLLKFKKKGYAEQHVALCKAFWFTTKIFLNIFKINILKTCFI